MDSISFFLLSPDFDLYVFMYKSFRRNLKIKHIFYLGLPPDIDLLIFLQSQNYSEGNL